MPHILLLSLRLLSCTIGAVAYYIAFFLHEDEEGSLQNRLEELWIRLMDRRKTSLSKATLLMQGVAQLTNKAFDSLLGTKLLSFRAVGASLWLSLSSACFISLLLGHLKLQGVKPIPTSIMRDGLLFLAIGLLPLALGDLAVFVWIVPLVFIVFQPLVIVLLMSYKLWGIESSLRELLIFSLIFLTSFSSDVLFVTGTRLLLRHLRSTEHLYRIAASLILNVVAACLLVTIPVGIGLQLLKIQWFHFAAIYVFAAVLLNTADVVVCSIFFVILTVLLLHRATWPALERPLYAVQRLGIVGRRKLLISVGSAAFAAGFTGPYWSDICRSVLERLAPHVPVAL